MSSLLFPSPGLEVRLTRFPSGTLTVRLSSMESMPMISRIRSVLKYAKNVVCMV